MPRRWIARRVEACIRASWRMLSAGRDYSVAELVASAAPAAPLIVVLDGIEDPHNVGAILRTADAAGVHGVIRQERHSAALDGVVAKASAGALAHLANCDRRQHRQGGRGAQRGVGSGPSGLDGASSERYDQVDLTLPTAIVLGAEGSGLRRLVRERCDRLVSIPMRGAVESLNVSVAAGVALFEAARQRRAAGSRATG